MNVNKNNYRGIQRDTNQGLGSDRVDNLEKDDDEFDAYRKRMMLAYRFRPNPLVCNNFFNFKCGCVKSDKYQVYFSFFFKPK